MRWQSGEGFALRCTEYSSQHAQGGLGRIMEGDPLQRICNASNEGTISIYPQILDF